ncbi:unnamed protein product [Burkholderia pseudomallei]|nr:unnamed protein product [Burkholderia pseudomallei]VUD64544.1 unnamed protein product [Burkholderia pseudomallei]
MDMAIGLLTNRVADNGARNRSLSADAARNKASGHHGMAATGHFGVASRLKPPAESRIVMRIGAYWVPLLRRATRVTHARRTRRFAMPLSAGGAHHVRMSS